MQLIQIGSESGSLVRYAPRTLSIDDESEMDAEDAAKTVEEAIATEDEEEEDQSWRMKPDLFSHVPIVQPIRYSSEFEVVRTSEIEANVSKAELAKLELPILPDNLVNYPPYIRVFVKPVGNIDLMPAGHPVNLTGIRSRPLPGTIRVMVHIFQFHSVFS